GILSLVLAILLVVLLLPQLNEITGKHLALSIDQKGFLCLGGIGLLTGLVSGIYPSFYLSRFRPAAVLKGKIDASLSELLVRKGLVIFQFVVSMIFIAGVMVVTRQMEFIQNKNLGYSRSHVISFPWKGNVANRSDDRKSDQSFFTFLSNLRNIPGVVAVSNMSGNILNEIYGQTDVSWRGEDADKAFLFQSPVVGYDFMKTLEIEVIAGRAFSRERQDDYSKIILNEAAVKKMGLEDPVGETIGMNGTSEIVGVVKDFNYGSLHDKIEPLIFRFDPRGRNVILKIVQGSERVAIEQIKNTYEEFLPGYVFEYAFMDDEYQALYESENRIAHLSRYSSGMAIIISCLGLLGLVHFTVQARLREIGIRKVLGSNVSQIVWMLVRNLSKTVIYAIIVGLPIGYLIMNVWLDQFAYSIELGWELFLVAGLCTLLIAWITVSVQTIKAALINPVNFLRNE
ncbi:MAG: FtsX-like permease family protein, partial [Bacteroidota bacterium]